MSQQSRPAPRYVAPPPAPAVPPRRQPLRSTIPVLLPAWAGPYLDRLAAVFAVPLDALGQRLERSGYDGPVHYKQAQLRAARARGYVPPAPDLPELPSMPDAAPWLARHYLGPTPDELYRISK